MNGTGAGNGAGAWNGENPAIEKRWDVFPHRFSIAGQRRQALSCRSAARRYCPHVLHDKQPLCMTYSAIPAHVPAPGHCGTAHILSATFPCGTMEPPSMKGGDLMGGISDFVSFLSMALLMPPLFLAIWLWIRHK